MMFLRLLAFLITSVVAFGSGLEGEAAPAARVVLQGGDTDLKRTRQVPLHVINQLTRPVSVRRAIVVERWQNNHWQMVRPISGLLLRADCRPDPKTGVINTPALLEGCLVVAAGSTFKAPPWLGTVGDAQCVCEQCVSAEPGLYRYRGRLCDRDQPVFGAPFKLK